MKQYKAPMLYVDTFAADTAVASSPKNGNADNNQNCWGCDQAAGSTSGENACFYNPSMGSTYTDYCG